MQIEHDLVGLWIIVYVILAAIGTIVLHSSLGDKNRLACIARNSFAVLFIVAGLVWLLP